MTNRRLFLFDGDDRRWGTKGWALVDVEPDAPAASISVAAEPADDETTEPLAEVEAIASVIAAEPPIGAVDVPEEDPPTAGGRRRRRPSPVRDPPPGGPK